MLAISFASVRIFIAQKLPCVDATIYEQSVRFLPSRLHSQIMRSVLSLGADFPRYVDRVQIYFGNRLTGQQAIQTSISQAILGLRSVIIMSCKRLINYHLQCNHPFKAIHLRDVHTCCSLRVGLSCISIQHIFKYEVLTIPYDKSCNGLRLCLAGNVSLNMVSVS